MGFRCPQGHPRVSETWNIQLTGSRLYLKPTKAFSLKKEQPCFFFAEYLQGSLLGQEIFVGPQKPSWS